MSEVGAKCEKTEMISSEVLAKLTVGILKTTMGVSRSQTGTYGKQKYCTKIRLGQNTTPSRRRTCAELSDE